MSLANFTTKMYRKEQNLVLCAKMLLFKKIGIENVLIWNLKIACW